MSGDCGRCGKKGHKQLDCWAKIVGSVETYGEASDTWHEGEGGWSNGWHEGHDQGWWGQAADSPAPGTLAPVTAQVGAGGNGWILTLTKDVMIGGIHNPGKMIDLIGDSGAESTVCGPNDFPEFPMLRDGPEVRLHAADGRALKWYGRKPVSFEAHGERLYVEFNVVDVTRPILSVASMTDNGNEVILGRTGG